MKTRDLKVLLQTTSCQRESSDVWRKRLSLDWARLLHVSFFFFFCSASLVEIYLTLFTDRLARSPGHRLHQEYQTLVVSLFHAENKNLVWSLDCVSPTQALLMRSELSKTWVWSRVLFWLLTVIWSLAFFVLPVSWTLCEPVGQDGEKFFNKGEQTSCMWRTMINAMDNSTGGQSNQ